MEQNPALDQTNVHDRDGIVVEDGRDVFGWELVGGVGDEHAGLADGTVAHDDTPGLQLVACSGQEADRYLLDRGHNHLVGEEELSGQEALYGADQALPAGLRWWWRKWCLLQGTQVGKVFVWAEDGGVRLLERFLEFVSHLLDLALDSGLERVVTSRQKRIYSQILHGCSHGEGIAEPY